jgi:ferrous iron transport protein A
MKKELMLVNLETGDVGLIVKILGGYNLIRKLDSLGIRPGKNITMISSMLMNGPITVKVNNTKVAIGRGMADKIMVELRN